MNTTYDDDTERFTAAYRRCDAHAASCVTPPRQDLAKPTRIYQARSRMAVHTTTRHRNRPDELHTLPLKGLELASVPRLLSHVYYPTFADVPQDRPGEDEGDGTGRERAADLEGAVRGGRSDGLPEAEWLRQGPYDASWRALTRLGRGSGSVRGSFSGLQSGWRSGGGFKEGLSF